MRILYIDIDSLRPDHLGCYGYSRATSPNIDRLAAEGVVFDNVHVSDAPCMPSRTSLFSGRFGIHHGCVSHTGTRAEPFPEGPGRKFRSQWGRTNWMRHLRDAALHTATFSSFGERHSAWHWYAGFAETHDTGHFGHDIANQITPAASEWLRRNARKENWFLHVNYWDVHTPYRAPAEMGNPFAESPLPHDWLTQEVLDRHRREPGIRSARDALFLRAAAEHPRNPASLETLADVKQMVDGYDVGIRYTDQHVGQLLGELEALGVLDETAVIISADHGENLGELNSYGGHCFADQLTTRVPLIIRWPGITDAGTRRSALHYHIDLAATVNQCLGIGSHPSWDARGFAEALKPGGPDTGRDHLVLAQMAQTCQRSVRFLDAGRDCLYLRTYRNGYYALPENLIFDIGADPHEQRNLAEARPDLVERAAGLLDTWHGEMLEGQTHEDPLTIVLGEPPEDNPDRYRERLRQTGRGHWAESMVNTPGSCSGHSGNPRD